MSTTKHSSGRELGKRAAAAALFFMALIALSVALAPSALGHDLWLEPSSFVTPVGERLDVALRLGHADAPEAQPRDSRRTVRFIVLGPLGEETVAERPVLGLDGADPAGVIRPEEPGRYVIAYRSTDARSELPADRFESYLLEEGLETIRDLRRERGEAESPGTELFSRAVKTLVRVEALPSADAANAVKDPAPEPEAFDRRLGLRLELTAESDPLAWRDGGELPFRLWFEDEPIAGVRVDAVSLDRPGMSLEGRTDEDGGVSFVLPHGGRWFVSAVHMVEAPEGAAQDWQSIWSTLSFSAGSPANTAH